MSMKNRILAFFLSIALANPLLVVQAKEFTSIDVIKDAHSFQCLDYKIIQPICIYLLIICTPFGCYIRYYLRDRITHNHPDLVVTAFRKPGMTPWKEMRKTAGKLGLKALNSSTIRGKFDNHQLSGATQENALVSRGGGRSVKNNRFNEVNIVGSPAPAVIRNTMKYGVPRIFGSQFLCKSYVSKYRPYFMSEVDAIAWRKAELNPHPSIYIPGAREIGSKSTSNPLGNTWGKVHPRIGFVIQTEPSKAAAVASQRAIDIVTQKNQLPHIYTSYGTSSGEVEYVKLEAGAGGCNYGDEGGGFGTLERDPNCVKHYNNNAYSAGGDNDNGQTQTLDQACPVKCYSANSFAQTMPPADEKTKAWQIITPISKKSCEAFGSADQNWAKQRNTEDGDYGHNYWRKYKCCKPAPGKLLNP